MELLALARHCLDRCISTLEQVQQEVLAWQQERNQARISIDWRFTPADAWMELKRPEPILT